MTRLLASVGILVLSSWLLVGLWFLRKVRSLEDHESASDHSAYPAVPPEHSTDVELFATVLAGRIARRARQLHADEWTVFCSYVAAREVLAVFLEAPAPRCMEAIDDFLTCNEIGATPSPGAPRDPGGKVTD